MRKSKEGVGLKHDRSIEGPPFGDFPAIWAEDRVGKTRYFLLLVLTLGALIGALVVLNSSVNQNHPVPVAVELDAKGAVVKTAPLKPWKPERPAIESKASEFAKALLAIDPFTTRAAMERAARMLRGAAVEQWQAHLARERVFIRMNDDPHLLREARILSVDASTPGLVFVSIETVEQNATLKAPPIAWRLTVHYSVGQPTERDIYDDLNPAGMRITHFELKQELKVEK